MSNPFAAAIKEVDECVGDTGTDEERAAWAMLRPVLEAAG